MEPKTLIIRYPNGKIRERYNFNEQHVYHGEYMSFYKNGATQEIVHYEHGSAVGIAYGFYNKKNKRYSLRTAKKGTPHGVHIYFMKYQNIMETEIRKSYWDNGIQHTEYHVNNSVLEKLNQCWNDNGGRFFIRKWKFGRCQGLEIIFNYK